MDAGCPCESYLVIKSGSSQELGLFLMADRNAYFWQHIKIPELSGIIFAIKFYMVEYWEFLKMAKVSEGITNTVLVMTEKVNTVIESCFLLPDV